MPTPHDFRILFEYHYRLTKHTAPHAPSMWPFLSVPLKERLTLLALPEEATMAECKQALPWMKETDHRLTSHRIHHALSCLVQALEHPTDWINPGPMLAHETGDLADPTTPFPVPDRLIPTDTDKQVRQALYPSPPLLLFGALVPAALHELSLQPRAIIYCLVVEEMTWGEIQMLFECSEWAIRQAIRQVYAALGGDGALGRAIQALPAIFPVAVGGSA